MHVSVRFPKPLHDELKRQAELRGVSINWLVNRAIEEYLDRNYPNAPELVAAWRVRKGSRIEAEEFLITTQDDVDKAVESLYELLLELRGEADGDQD